MKKWQVCAFAAIAVIQWSHVHAANDVATRSLLQRLCNGIWSDSFHDEVQTYIDAGADVNAYGCCSAGSTNNGRLDAYLADSGQCSRNSYTPLQHVPKLMSNPAPAEMAVRTVRSLLRAGADPNKPNYTSNSDANTRHPLYPMPSEMGMLVIKALVEGGMRIPQANTELLGLEELSPESLDYLRSVASPGFVRQMNERLQLVQLKAQTKRQREAEQVEAKRRAEMEQEAARKAAEVRARNDQKAFAAASEQFRKKVLVGDSTHCGMVIERKDPILKVQTIVGERWFRINQIYPAGSRDCRFYNGQYVE